MNMLKDLSKSKWYVIIFLKIRGELLQILSKLWRITLYVIICNVWVVADIANK
jgi:hypothetical protein